MGYPNYHIDNKSLREVLSDTQDTLMWCQMNEHNPEVVSYYRMLGNLEKAKALGYDFVKKFKGTEKEVTALIRLASVYHWQEAYEQSETLYNDALVLFDIVFNNKNMNHIKAFIYQHQAKLYIDWKKIDKAKEAINKAYVIRKQCDPQRLSSTQQVINRLKEIDKNYNL